MTEGEGGLILGQNCVTSFMNAPLCAGHNFVCSEYVLVKPAEVVLIRHVSNSSRDRRLGPKLESCLGQIYIFV